MGSTLTKDDLLASARELRPIFAERAELCDRERRIPDESLHDLHEAGFFRYLTPEKWGGHGGSFIDLLECGAELAKGCPSTSWIQTIVCIANAMVGSCLPPEGASVIYDSSEPPMVCAVINPAGGAARPVQGGYSVSGSWGFASGCLHCNWIFAALVVLDDGGQMVNQGFAFIPVSALAIKDTWHVAGMRGTGSNTVVADNVFVPHNLMMMMTDRFAAESQVSPGAPLFDRMPFASLFSVCLTGAPLGAAAGALELVSQQAHTRGIAYFDFERQIDSAVVLERLGEVALQIDTAWLHVRRGAHELEETTKQGPLDVQTRARTRADAGHAVEQLRRAMDTLVSIGGASSFADANPLQRYWRDLNVVTRHAFLNTRPLYETYGRAYCGVEPNITGWL